MPTATIESELKELINSWYEHRLPKATHRVVSVNNAAFRECAKKVARDMNMIGAYDVERDLDANKACTAYAFGIAEDANILKFSPPHGQLVSLGDKNDIRRDCALDVYLEMLQVDRKSVLADIHIGSTLKAMFFDLVSKQHPADGPRLVALRAVSILAYTLERSHPLLQAR